MRRTRSTVLAVVAAGALVFAACGGDDEESIDAKDSTEETAADDSTDDTTEESTDETTEESTDDTMSEEDLSPLAEQFAEGFAESAGFELKPEESECMVDGMFEEFGLAELAELGRSTSEPSAAVMNRLGGVMDDCISTDALVSLFESQGLDTEAASCLVDGIVDEGYQISDIMKVGLDDTTPEAAEFAETVTNLAISCGAGG